MHLPRVVEQGDRLSAIRGREHSEEPHKQSDGQVRRERPHPGDASGPHAGALVDRLRRPGAGMRVTNALMQSLWFRRRPGARAIPALIAAAAVLAIVAALYFWFTQGALLRPY